MSMKVAVAILLSRSLKQEKWPPEGLYLSHQFTVQQQGSSSPTSQDTMPTIRVVGLVQI